MVATLILFLLLIVFLAFFVGKNLNNLCTIWFFKEFPNIPVATLVFIAFACGLVCALLLLMISKLKKKSSKSSTQTSEESEKNSDKTQKKVEKAQKKNEKSKAASRISKLKFKKEKNEVAVADEDKTIVGDVSSITGE